MPEDFKEHVQMEGKTPNPFLMMELNILMLWKAAQRKE